jgi:hypothetical protein
MMPRKNNRAGQPNRAAQMERRASRREINMVKDPNKRVYGQRFDSKAVTK